MNYIFIFYLSVNKDNSFQARTAKDPFLYPAQVIQACRNQLNFQWIQARFAEWMWDVSTFWQRHAWLMRSKKINQTLVRSHCWTDLSFFYTKNTSSLVTLCMQDTFYSPFSSYVESCSSSNWTKQAFWLCIDRFTAHDILKLKWQWNSMSLEIKVNKLKITFSDNPNENIFLDSLLVL